VGRTLAPRGGGATQAFEEELAGVTPRIAQVAYHGRPGLWGSRSDIEYRLAVHPPSAEHLDGFGKPLPRSTPPDLNVEGAVGNQPHEGRQIGSSFALIQK
jgi:hypothetical protein